MVFSSDKLVVVVNFIFAIIIFILFMDLILPMFSGGVNRAALAKHEFPSSWTLTRLLHINYWWRPCFYYILNTSSGKSGITKLDAFADFRCFMSFLLGYWCRLSLDLLCCLCSKKTLRAIKRTLIILASLSGLLIITTLYLWFSLKQSRYHVHGWHRKWQGHISLRTYHRLLQNGPDCIIQQRVVWLWFRTDKNQDHDVVHQHF